MTDSGEPQRDDPPSDEIRIDPDDWPHHVAPARGPQVVVGGPGTGKTEFLVRRVQSAITGGAPPSSILVLTFSRLSVNDLRTRLFNAVGSASYQVNVSTYHSLANRIVEAGHALTGWADSPTVLAGPEHEQFVAEILATEDPSQWYQPYQPILSTRAFAEELTDFILRFQEQGTRISDLERTAVPEWKGIGSFLHRYEAQMQERGRVDYGRLLADAVRVVDQEPRFAEEYRHVLADEYQDTSPIQAQLLFSLARHTGSLTVAADPYQSIFSFRGTDIHNVLDFPARAAQELGEAAERLVLTTSFRVPSQILDAAVNVTLRELPGAAGKVNSLNDRGIVSTHVFDNLDAESDWIASDIERVHLADGIALERIAVFTRDAGDMHQRLAMALERRGIPHGLTDEHLQDQPVVRFVDDLIAVATSEGSSSSEEFDELNRSILLGPFVAAPVGAVNAIGRAVDAGSTWPDAMRDSLPDTRDLADLMEDSGWATDLPATEGLWNLWQRAPFLHRIAVDDDAEEHRRAWSAFFQSVARFAERTEGATLADRTAISHASDVEADALFSFRTDSHAGVTIATLHRAKGTEFDVVYIANAVEGLLPDLRTKDSLLKTRLLNERLPEDPVAYVQFRLNEERRLAYTAMTRATHRVVWTATEVDSPFEQLEPSRFIPQVAPPTEPGRGSRPLTRRGYESSLRRTLRDPKAKDTSRLAALSVLSAGPSLGLADQRHRYGVVEHGDDAGFVPPDHTASPSQATTFDECPRRYVMERFASQKESDSVYLRFGNLIHKVLENVERTALEDGRSRSTLAEATDELDTQWTHLGFGDDGVGSAWYRRAETALQQLYELWPNHGDIAKVEHDVAIDLDDTAWRGKIDRIETGAGSVKVVDYKTSKSPMPVADANESLQLGFYVLAAMQVESISTLGEVNGAEFWYPSAKPRKNSIATRSFDMANLGSVRERLVSIALAIRDEQFPATINDRCDRCDFLYVCPAQPQGQEAFVS